MANLAALLLGSRTITAALSDVIITEGASSSGAAQGFWDRLAGITALQLVATLTVVGTPGTSVQVDVDTAFGSGGAWLAFARFKFTTTTATKRLVISCREPLLVATDLAVLSDNTGINLFGDRVRARCTSVLAYGAGTLLDVRAQPIQ
jgi:hypothetical protein